MEMTQEQFEEIKKSLVEFFESNDFYPYELKRAIDAHNWYELKDVIIDNILWCIDNEIAVPNDHYKNEYKEFTIVDGKLHGKYVSYWPDGKINDKRIYYNGKIVEHLA